MISTNLFDKIIDVQFTVDYEEYDTVALRSNTKSKNISFRTPPKGQKPEIAIYFEAIPGENVASLTIKLTNFYSEINIAQYKYVLVRAGYATGQVSTMSGQITNCYIEKPNPDGITVFSCTIGTIADMFWGQGEASCLIDNNTVEETLNKLAAIYNLKANVFLPAEWKSIKFAVKTMYNFTSPLTMRTWLAGELDNLARIYDLPRLYLSVVSGSLGVYSLTASNKNETAILIDKVSSAYLMGGNIVIKAPWNPLIVPGAGNGDGTIFKMDTRFFRGRVGTLQVGGEKKTFRVIQMKVAFSTRGENSMELNALAIEQEGTGK